MVSVNRRRFLGRLLALAGAAGSMGALPESIRKALAIPAATRTGTIADVQHIVVLMQENRSFDHYFGHLRGVRGYNDRFPVPLANGQPVWCQPSKSDPARPVLPFHLDTSATSAQCIGDLDHTWYPTHRAINNGRNDRWPANKTDMSMGYHLRSDIPFHYALADAFTICDAYFCSMPGPTHPNRTYLMTGTVDSSGTKGGPLLDNNDYITHRKPPEYQVLSWTTYPERLQEAGISWRIYQQGTNGRDLYQGNFGTNILQNFENYINAKRGTPLHDRALTARTLNELRADVMADQLPQVSWLLPSAIYSEHPNFMPAFGAAYIAQVIDALTANPDVWSKTVLFVMYDENDGFFDHVPPPQPPANDLQGRSTVGVEDELHTIVNPGRGKGYTADGLPYGLGPRVPMTVVSPWTKGGFVCSQVFDHTSVIRFIEARFGVHEPNITPWRRAVTGDLTSAFDFGAPDARVPSLPDATAQVSAATRQCMVNPKPIVPAVPGTIDAQEPGVRPARALPYELHASGAPSRDGRSFELAFDNTGRQGAHFYVYAIAREDGPWRYTVEAGKSLTANLPLVAQEKRYEYEVHGPNGFVRRFRGRGEGSGVGVTVQYDVKATALRVKLSSASSAPANVTITDNAYGVAARKIRLAAHGERAEAWSLERSSRWYDLSVTVAEDDVFLCRFAGHLENGEPGVSDPAAVAPVTVLR
ncbi:phosphocholine-specific phospholipase C [Caballeronia sp. J97]|uniref:phosphocholine-specific phospholipase C n=1 Tax=Caballeronia sp. J97 TaxID=2805429 RepID=UPI002AAF1D16|nr:phospholipase C, phosphocholine-specific [Caballeronia sp. J97]